MDKPLCALCGKPILRTESVLYKAESRKLVHLGCEARETDEAKSSDEGMPRTAA